MRPSSKKVLHDTSILPEENSQNLLISVLARKLKDSAHSDSAQTVSNMHASMYMQGSIMSGTSSCMAGCWRLEAAKSA